MQTENQKSSKIKIPINPPLIVMALVIIAGSILYFQFENKTTMSTVKIGNVVVVDYVGTLEDGSIFDTSIKSVALQNGMNPQKEYNPLEFKVGDGQMIKGFDDAAIGMRVGQTKKITLQPEEAYGNVQDNLILTVNSSTVQTGGQILAVGGIIELQNGGTGVITDIENDAVTIDFNHPLAGKILNFEITLVKILS